MILEQKAGRPPVQLSAESKVFFLSTLSNLESEQCTSVSSHSLLYVKSYFPPLSFG